MKIFINKVIKSNNLTKLGQRLQYLLKDKENNNLFRKILIFLYDNINLCLSKLEKIFAEYKFKGNNNLQKTAQTNNNNNNIENHNNLTQNQNEFPEINNRRNRSMDLIIMIMDYFQNQRNIITLLTDEEN